MTTETVIAGLEQLKPVEAANYGNANSVSGDNTTHSVQAPYNLNLTSIHFSVNPSNTDVVFFNHSLMRSSEPMSAHDRNQDSTSVVAEVLSAPFDHIDKQAQALAEIADGFASTGTELSPGEMLMLTARSQEFLFHSQLTANIANRTVDGVHQLFRQQG